MRKGARITSSCLLIHTGYRLRGSEASGQQLNLRELESLEGVPLIAVSKDLADAQHTGVERMRGFVTGHSEDEVRQAAMLVHTVWTCGSVQT